MNSNKYILELFACDVSVEISGHTLCGHKGQYLSVVLITETEISCEESHASLAATGGHLLLLRDEQEGGNYL